MFLTKYLKLSKCAIVFPFALLFSNITVHADSCIHLYEQKDFKAAEQQCSKDAKQHLSSADFILGQLYEKGLSVEKNTNKALSYYRRALLNNNVDSQIALGKFHAKNKNFLSGHVFFSLAVSNGSLNALHLKNQINNNLTHQEAEQSKAFIELIKDAIIKERKQLALN